MSETKSHHFRPPLYHRESPTGRGGQKPTTAEARSEQQGWEAYRKWLSSVSGKPRGERAPIDHSIYSWKGYHSWADRVRQTWKSEDNENK